jgi:hypothetical protein
MDIADFGASWSCAISICTFNVRQTFFFLFSVNELATLMAHSAVINIGPILSNIISLLEFSRHLLTLQALMLLIVVVLPLVGTQIESTIFTHEKGELILTV